MFYESFKGFLYWWSFSPHDLIVIWGTRFNTCALGMARPHIWNNRSVIFLFLFFSAPHLCCFLLHVWIPSYSHEASRFTCQSSPLNMLGSSHTYQLCPCWASLMISSCFFGFLSLPLSTHDTASRSAEHRHAHQESAKTCLAVWKHGCTLTQSPLCYLPWL